MKKQPKDGIKAGNDGKQRAGTIASKEEETKRQYRLFVLPTDEKTMEAAETERFFRATPRYSLMFSEREPSFKHAEITPEHIYRLSADDMNWLRDCSLVLYAEAARAHEKEIASDMNARLDRLEAALKTEKEKQKEG